MPMMPHARIGVTLRQQGQCPARARLHRRFTDAIYFHEVLIAQHLHDVQPLNGPISQELKLHGQPRPSLVNADAIPACAVQMRMLPCKGRSCTSRQRRSADPRNVLLRSAESASPSHLLLHLRGDSPLLRWDAHSAVVLPMTAALPPVMAALAVASMLWVLQSRC